jgi:hypothetical protein
MLETINDKRVLERITSYFEMLRKTGYIKPGTTSRYLLYVFLFDFVDTLYDFMTEEDYIKINNLLRSIFGDGNCLLPYRRYIDSKAKVGVPHHTGYITKRVPELQSGDKERYAEQDNQLRLKDYGEV